jgi:hypothetical protein
MGIFGLWRSHRNTKGQGVKPQPKYAVGDIVFYAYLWRSEKGSIQFIIERCVVITIQYYEAFYQHHYWRYQVTRDYNYYGYKPIEGPVKYWYPASLLARSPFIAKMKRQKSIMKWRVVCFRKWLANKIYDPFNQPGVDET